MMTLAQSVEIEAMRDVLEECREYFDGRADAEYFTDQPTPKGNEEMRLLVRINEVLK